MGSSTSVSKPTRRKCQQCQTLITKTWKCYDCDKVLCDQCIDSIHNKHHTGRYRNIDKQNNQVQILKVIQHYKTHLRDINWICSCTDDSMWIADYYNQTVHFIKVEGDKMNQELRIKTSVKGMTISASGDLLLSTWETARLQQINEKKGNKCDTVYDVTPLHPRAIHVNDQGKVIVGGFSEIRAAVIVMDKQGQKLQKYEYDNKRNPIFACPCSITCTSNGYLHVADRMDDNCVITLNEKGDVKSIYKGNSAAKDRQFFPLHVITSSRDNVIVLDSNCYLHILSNTGQFLLLYNMIYDGITRPMSLAINFTGLLWIGSRDNETSSLYLVNLMKY